MIGEVNKALALYNALTTVGKKLFRGELGLVRPQQATKRRARKVLSVAEPTEATPSRVIGKLPRRRRSARALDTQFPVTDQPAA